MAKTKAKAKLAKPAKVTRKMLANGPATIVQHADGTAGDNLPDAEAPHVSESVDAVTGSIPAPPAKPATDPLTPEELAAYDAETVQMVCEAEDRAKAAESTYENSKEVASADKKRYEARVDELRKMIHDRSENRGKRPKPEAPTLLDVLPKWRGYPLDRIAVLNSDPATCPEPNNCECVCPSCEASDIHAMLTAAGIDTLGELSDQIGPAYAEEAPSFGMTREVNDSIREQIHAIVDAEYKDSSKGESDLYKQYPLDRWTRFGLTAKDVEKLHACETKGTATGLPIITMGDLQRFVTPNPAAPNYVQSVKDIKGIGDAGCERIGEAELLFWSWWRAGGEAEFAAELNPPAETPAAQESEAA